MSSIFVGDDRHLVPRWRGLRATYREGELNSLDTPVRPEWIEDSVELEAREAEWRAEHSVSFAADLLGAALVRAEYDRAIEAAREIWAAPEVQGLPRTLAKRILAEAEGVQIEPPDGTGDESPEERVRTLRSRVRRDPRGAVDWTELARAYISLGLGESASRAMRIAQTLAPNDRFILRSAASLAIHRDEPDRAHALIANADATQHDPWLIATELATASLAEQQARFVRRGRDFAGSEQFAPLHLAELRSALGTLELNAANTKRSRRLFKESLRDPNENTIAQAQWASRQDDGFEFDEQYLLEHESFEASAWIYGRAGQWREALQEAWKWLLDQPFTNGPGEFGSYQASLGQDYHEGERIARVALVANPGDFTILNNLIVCLLNLGRTDEAAQLLKRVRVAELGEGERPFYLATSGLLEFRTGNPLGGELLYQEALGALKDPRFRAVASILLVKERILSGAEVPLDHVQQLLDRDWGPEATDVQLWLEHLRTAVETRHGIILPRRAATGGVGV
jgi:tetratricopeptide (TPR) repeat protein